MLISIRFRRLSTISILAALFYLPATAALAQIETATASIPDAPVTVGPDGVAAYECGGGISAGDDGTMELGYSSNGNIVGKFTLGNVRITKICVSFWSNGSTSQTYNVKVFDATGGGGTTPGNLKSSTAGTTATGLSATPSWHSTTVDVPMLAGGAYIGLDFISPEGGAQATGVWHSFDTGTNSDFQTGFDGGGWIAAADGTGFVHIVTAPLNVGTFTVSKSFSDSNTGGVTVNISCTNAVIMDGSGGTGTATAAAPKVFTLGWDPADSPTCTATETVPTGYTNNTGAACTTVGPLVNGGNSGCTLVNTQNPVTFTVNKVFSDSNPSASGTMSLACTGVDPADITPASAAASTGSPAVFTVSNFPFAGTTCTATETVIPAGYTPVSATCNGGIGLASNGACTITNNQNPVLVTIDKLYTETHPLGDPEVPITLICPNATVAEFVVDPMMTDSANPAPPPGEATAATDSGTASFMVSNFPWDGTNCWATETVPAGYVESANTCGTVGAGTILVSPGVAVADPACAITNRPTEAEFTIGKDFSDGNPNLGVVVTPLCTDDDGGATITYTPTGGTAYQSTDVTVAVKYFHANATCMATEADPVGYTQAALPAGQDCQSSWAISDSTDNSCALYNQQDPITVRAMKNFTDGSGLTVNFEMACPGGGTVSTIDGTATNGTEAVFEVVNFPWNGTVCNVTEPVVPGGYYIEASTCDNLAIVPSDADTLCTITDSPTRATFHVVKGFSDDNPMPVEITLSCNTGLPLEQTKMIVDDNSSSGGVDFVVTDYTQFELDCVVTEAPVLGYLPNFTNRSDDQSSELNDEGCFYEDVAGDGDHSCFIKNELQQVEIEVTKIWFDDHPDFNNSTYAKARWYCDDSESNSKVIPDDTEGYGGCYGYDECGSLHFYGTPSVSSFSIYPHYDGTYCHVSEKVYDSGVESDDSDCYGLWVYPGIGADCEIINTRYYEGIPTLSQYGLVVLALLMLGVGMVGFRRFV